MPKHVVVDGSNIATEGRTAPSLTQLSEAVEAFMDEFPDVKVTVVVDATFGHRISSKESKIFDEAIENNELVAPPAGAVGRGDAFVLSIAKKVGAAVLSNDSYQEFHGQHEWLFDEGRLIGGKPVPNVGWVFVNRVPVRGPLSRRAQREGKNGPVKVPYKASKEASAPMPIPKGPPPKPKLAVASQTEKSDKIDARKAAKKAKKSAKKAAKTETTRPTTSTAANELLPFLSFVEKHPIGSKVKGVVDSYASHGAFVRIGDVFGYWPMRLMSSPQPRRPRDIAQLGDKVDLIVAGFTPSRRSIDIGLAELVNARTQTVKDPVKKSAKTKSTTAPTKSSAAKKVAAKKVASPAKKANAKKVSPVKKAVVKKVVADKKASAKKSSVKKVAAKK